MSTRTKVLVGLALWFIATTYLTALLLLPFLPVRHTETMWKLLVAPIGIMALLIFCGWHLTEKFGEFWTLRRLLGGSLVLLEATFVVAATVTIPEETVSVGARYGFLFLATVLIATPLGLAGLALLVRRRTKKGNAHATD